MNSFLETFIQECIIDQLFYSTDDSNFELPPQQQCILICLSRPVVAPVLWEKNSGEARKTPRHLKTNHSLLSCIWDPFSVWTAVTVFPKASFKKPQYPPFDINSQHSTPGNLTFLSNVPRVASIAGDSCSHLEVGRSSPQFGFHPFVLHIKAPGRHLKASQTERECASPAVLLKQLCS